MCGKSTDVSDRALALQLLQDFDLDLRLEGVLLNKIGGPAHLAWLEEAIQGADVRVRVVGGIPKVRFWPTSRISGHRARQRPSSCCAS